MKFLSNPRGISTYATNVEGPGITLYHETSKLTYDLTKFKLSFNKYVYDSKFISGNLSAEELYNQAVEAYTYIMDRSSEF